MPNEEMHRKLRPWGDETVDVLGALTQRERAAVPERIVQPGADGSGMILNR